MYNIIGDIAGRYNELMKLIEIMPKADTVILVGDLVDRGRDSKKVVEWAIANSWATGGNVITLKGNHEAMMVEAWDSGGLENDHTYNGGRATMQSYGILFPDEYPTAHIKWMRDLPISFETTELFISHAPWHRSWPLGEVVSEHWALWHRDYPGPRDGVYQVHGHNHLAESYVDDDGREFGRCIDNCGKKVLTGFTFPDKKIYEVPYE